MTLPLWREEAIAKTHDRKAFDCGNAEMNDFLRRYARQSHELGGAKTFLAVDDSNPIKILGFYSLAPASLAALMQRLAAAARSWPPSPCPCRPTCVARRANLKPGTS